MKQRLAHVALAREERVGPRDEGGESTPSPTDSGTVSRTWRAT
jgi:hypothetical protein